jgi:topoisomerase-4 subunit A
MAARKKKQPETVIKEDIEVSSLDELMGERFGIYAKDVIQERAIPDARDGLKPVQRRIVYDMWNTGNTSDKPTKKSAHIVGDVMGKYHPHGDASIYDALAHLSQSWRLRYPLVEFQGNNGSMDGDDPAAPRYTEARLSKISDEMVRDLNMDTVDMELTYDDSSFEPVVLPSRFPNLFANGSSGIAVGLATEIPPHNLKEVCQAVIHRIKHRNCTYEDLMKYVPGPDFPTGGIVYESQGLNDIYQTGRGQIKVAAKATIEVTEDGKKQIVVTEIPFGVIKSDLVYKIDKIRHDKTVAGIDEVRDESDKSGLRIAIDLREDANAEAILKYLMAKTNLMTSYSANMVAIVDGRPKTLSLPDYCDVYIAHQMDVITRRSRFLLAKDQARLSIVEGLIKAVSILDQVVAVIRKSNDKADSKVNLSKEFGFTPDQAEAIVMMPLYKLSHTDIATLEAERDSLKADIAYLNGLLSDTHKIEEVIIADLKKIMKDYGDARRTSIVPAESVDLSVNKRDLIMAEECYLVVSRDGYMKRSTPKSYKGSGGHNGARPGMKPGDAIVYCGACLTTDYIVAFTESGHYLYIPVNEVKDAKWNDIGGHVSTIVNIQPEERIVKALVVRKFRDDLNVVIVTAHGYVKRIKLSLFPVSRRSKPIMAIKLGKDDYVQDVTITSGNSDLFIVSTGARANLYNENDIYFTNPRSGGMKAGNFRGEDLAGVLAFDPGEKGKVLFVTDRGHTRVFDISKMAEGERLSKSTLLFNSFKSEPHRLIYMAKAAGKEPPITLMAILESGEERDVVFEDLYLTPVEKYAKRPEGFPAKARIAIVSKEDSSIVDEKVKAYEPVVKERPEEPAPEAPDPASIKNNFEQISLFDDDDEEDKG